MASAVSLVRYVVSQQQNEREREFVFSYMVDQFVNYDEMKKMDEIWSLDKEINFISMHQV